MKKIFFAIMILINLPIIVWADISLPVDGVITSGVGWRVDPFGSGKRAFHRGIDIGVPVGTPVRAIRKGQVVFAGARQGYGSTVILEHDNGDRTLYGHNSKIKVHPGELVDAGTVVAFSGNTGRSTGPHVHFEHLPSGRSVTEQVKVEETTKLQLVSNRDQRYMLDQKIDESVDSVLRTIIRFGTTSQGG